MADGLLSNILNFIDQRKQASMAGLGLLASNPQEYLTGRTEQLRDFTRAQEAGLPAERNQLRGLLVSPEQQAAQQYANQQLQDLALGFAGNIKPTPNINLKFDKAGRAVLTENTNPNILLTAGLDPNNTKYINPYLEVLDDPSIIGGKGTATRLYLRGLELAKQNNLGWKSDPISSDVTKKMYQRLINIGVPFKKMDNYFELSPEDLSKLNLEDISSKFKKK